MLLSFKCKLPDHKLPFICSNYSNKKLITKAFAFIDCQSVVYLTTKLLLVVFCIEIKLNVLFYQCATAVLKVFEELSDRITFF